MTGSIQIGDIIELHDLQGRFEILDIDWPGRKVCVCRAGVAFWVGFRKILAVRNRSARNPESISRRKKMAKILAEK